MNRTLKLLLPLALFFSQTAIAAESVFKKVEVDENLAKILSGQRNGKVAKDKVTQELYDILHPKKDGGIENKLKGSKEYGKVKRPIPFYPKQAPIPVADQTKEIKECVNDLNKAMHDIVKDEVQNNKQLFDKLMSNQVDLSFLKFAKAFINAGYYKYDNGANRVHAMNLLNEDIVKMYGVDNEDTKKKAIAIGDFFDQVADNGDEFKDISTAYKVIQDVSKKDAPEFHLNPSDLLIMDSVIHYADAADQTPKNAVAKDVLLNAMREVFPTRNFQVEDNDKLTRQMKKLTDEQRSYDNAKKEFVANAKKRLTDFAKSMDLHCQKYFIDKDELRPDLFAENCQAQSYFNNIFGNETIKDLTPIIEELKNMPVDNDTAFPEMAEIKIENMTCQNIDNEKLVIDFNVKNLPKSKRNSRWAFTCSTCTQSDDFENALRLESLDMSQSIKYTGEIPRTLTLSNPDFKETVTVPIEKCTFIQTPKDESKEPKVETVEKVEVAKEIPTVDQEAESEDPDKMLGDDEEVAEETKTASEEKIETEPVKPVSGMRYSQPLPGLPRFMPMPARAFYISPGFN